MSVDFSQYRHLTIPEGEVQTITDPSGRVIWRRRYVDRVPLSIDSSGRVYNGQGWRSGVRLSGSSGGERSESNASVIGFITVTPGDVIRMSYTGDNPKLWETALDIGAFSSFVYYDKSFAWLGSCVPLQDSGVVYGICKQSDQPTGGLSNGGIVTGRVPADSRIAYARLSIAIYQSGNNAAGNWVTFDQSLEPLVVTINEVLD